MPSNEYQQEFEATVKTVEDDYLILDQTCFYPEGGGQPSDRGSVQWEDGEAKITDVRKSHGEIHHYYDGDTPEEGQNLKGILNWERRFKHMRMHTAQHLVSYVVLKEFGASTAGNQIHEDFSRIDFEPAEFTDEDVENIQKLTNSLIEKGIEVEKEEMPRETVEEKVEDGRSNLELIPDNVDPLRVVRIGEIDYCPCGGTHVDNTEEVGKISITKRKSKGANVERIEFELG